MGSQSTAFPAGAKESEKRQRTTIERMRMKVLMHYSRVSGFEGKGVPAKPRVIHGEVSE
jgi:hypothetical protein